MKTKRLTNEAGDVRELTTADFEQAKPASEIFPELVEAQKSGKLQAKAVGRPKSENPKEATSIRLSPEVLQHFRGTGKGWQGRMDSVLMEYVVHADSALLVRTPQKKGAGSERKKKSA